MPGFPFGVVAAPAPTSVFVSLDSDGVNPESRAGLAVLHRAGSQLELRHVVPLSGVPAGMTLSRDGKRLLIANGEGVAVVDVGRALDNDPAAVSAELHGGEGSAVEVAVSPDGAYAFATVEYRNAVAVYHLPRTGRPAQLNPIARVPTDAVPVGITSTHDGRYLFVTTEGRGTHGNLDVIDVHRAAVDPAHAVVSRTPAGCSPVRSVLSSSGVLWVTARGSNALLAFDATRLIARSGRVLLASVHVGPSPVGVALVDNDRLVVVANSNRFADPTHNQTVSVVDARAALSHRAAVVRTIAAGRFPREIAALDDTHVAVGNYLSETVQLVPVTEAMR